MKAPTTEREVFDLTEAAHVVSLSRRTLERHIKAGTGPTTFRVGGFVRVSRAALMSWVEAQEAGRSPV